MLRVVGRVLRFVVVDIVLSVPTAPVVAGLGSALFG
jgi:hypothetical protein